MELTKQQQFKDKDLRPKLISWLTTKHNRPILEEVSIGSYRADLFTATNWAMFIYEIKSHKDNVNRFFKEQLPALREATEYIATRETLIIPECDYEKTMKALFALPKEEYERYGIGIITYNDRMTFKQRPNIYYVDQYNMEQKLDYLKRDFFKKEREKNENSIL